MSTIHINRCFDELAPQLLVQLSQCVPAECAVEVCVDTLAADRSAASWRVAFSCSDRSQAWITGQSLSDQQGIVTALIQSVLREMACQSQLSESQKFLQDYAIQVTNDFEVLTWLRNLAEQFEFCDVRNTMEEVAQCVLPSLRRILGAAAIEYVPPISAGGEAIADPPVRVCDGETVLTQSECQELAVRFGTDSRTVVVLNSSRLNGFESHYSNLRHCLIARLGNKPEQFGWILVLNRDGDRLQGMTEADLQLGTDEFGTFEAGLLQSAVTLFMTHGRNLALVHEKDTLLIGAIRSLIIAIDAKDAYTFGHSDRVAMIAKRLALQMGIGHRGCQEIYMTGLLHDIGKIGVPDAILGKPGKLTDEEFDQIKQHPLFGYRILSHLEQLSFALDGVLHHHEYYDGTGYPHRLQGEDIPLFGRILAVSDAYDAMTSDRPYRKGMSTERAEQILRDGAGTQWDPVVVDAFMASLDDIHFIRQRYDETHLSHGMLPAFESWTPSGLTTGFALLTS